MESYTIEGFSVTIKEKTKTESGKFTGQIHRKTIGPEADISEESEKVQEIVKAARIDYVRPVEPEVINE